MKKTVLSIFQNEKGRKKKRLTANLPEPQLDEDVIIEKKVKSGEGWSSSTLIATGIGRVLKHTQYNISKPTTFISEPTEGVVCLHIYVGNGASIGYQGEKTRLELNNGDSHSFWQGKQITESRLSADDDHHTVLKLYLRPECISHLSDRTEIMNIIDQALIEKNGPLDQLKGIYSHEFDMFLFEMMDELFNKKTSVERFHYLCDCLLLLYLGEQIEVEPRKGIEEDESESDKYSQTECEYCQREEEILSELENIDRTDLLNEIKKLQKKKQKLEKKIEKQANLDDKLHKIGAKLLRPIIKKVRADYMSAAYLFAEWYRKDLSEENKKILERGIIHTCDKAFLLIEPNLEELVFLKIWCKKDHNSVYLKELEVKDVMSKLADPEYVESGDREKIIDQMRQSIGLKSIEELSKEEAKDKPKEVVELYQKLMEHYSDTLVLGEDGEIKRSKIVRELDVSYFNNDLLTLRDIELESLALDANYVAQQEDERLRRFVASLREIVESLKLILEDFKVDPEFKDLQDYHRLGGDMEKFRRSLKKSYKKFNPLKDGISLILKDIEEFPLEKKVLNLAQGIVKNSKL